MTKTCKTCGKEFYAYDSRQVYCSDECRQIGKKSYEKQWRIRNKGQEEDKEKTCPICGKTFISNSSRKYCSKECAYKGARKAQKEWYEKNVKPKKVMEKECLYCGKKFTIKSHNQKYCSHECYGKALKEKRKEERRIKNEVLNEKERIAINERKKEINKKQRLRYLLNKDKPEGGCKYHTRCFECPEPNDCIY